MNHHPACCISEPIQAVTMRAPPSCPGWTEGGGCRRARALTALFWAYMSDGWTRTRQRNPEQAAEPSRAEPLLLRFCRLGADFIVRSGVGGALTGCPKWVFVERMTHTRARTHGLGFFPACRSRNAQKLINKWTNNEASGPWMHLGCLYFCDVTREEKCKRCAAVP